MQCVLSFPESLIIQKCFSFLTRGETWWATQYTGSVRRCTVSWAEMEADLGQAVVSSLICSQR